MKQELKVEMEIMRCEREEAHHQILYSFHTAYLERERNKTMTHELMRLHQKLCQYESRSYEETEAGIVALNRLLTLLETSDAVDHPRIAQFLLGVFGAEPAGLNMNSIRHYGMEIGDDVMAVLHASRWGRIPVGQMLPNALDRINRAIERAMP